MPPPQSSPDERADSVVPSTNGARRHIGKLFWVGVTIAPIAALLLVIANGVGPLRAAAALAILSVVLIGLSVVLRDDAAMVKDDVEDQLRTEVDRLRADIDSLRRGVEISVHRELERVHHELEATRRDNVVRAEAGRMSHNRLTAGELPAADEEYSEDRQRRGGRGRSGQPIRAITARGTETVGAAPGEPGYDWFGVPDSPAGAERREPREAATADPSGAVRADPAHGDAVRGEAVRGDAARYETGTYPATTYGTTRPQADQGGAAYPPEGRRPQRGAESSDAGTDGRGRRRRSSTTYGSAEAVVSGAAKPVGTEYGSSPIRRAGAPEGTTYEATTYGATTYGSAAAADAPAEEQTERRQPDQRWADEHSGGYEPPNYQPIDYDAAPPVYEGNRGDGGVYRGSRAAEASDLAAEDPSGTVDYTEFWARSATPPRSAPAARSGGDQDAGAEWSSWRETGTDWDTGQQRYNRDDPQVITGAITGAILDIPYSVGGQTLSEPDFGAGNGFGSGSGFGTGNGFAAGEPRWDEPPASAGWPGTPAASGADSGVASEFELPNLDHLPQAGGSAEKPSDSSAPDPAGGRHARRRSW